MDNPSDLRKSNLVSEHQHVFKPKGGFMWWAECECGEKLAGENGVVVGSKAKVERLLRAS